jgi:hypothetical protein
MPQDPQFLGLDTVDHAADVAVAKAVRTESWVRRNIVKLHLGFVASVWGVFEFLAPRAAQHVHEVILHVFWHDFVRNIVPWIR